MPHIWQVTEIRPCTTPDAFHPLHVRGLNIDDGREPRAFSWQVPDLADERFVLTENAQRDLASIVETAHSPRSFWHPALPEVRIAERAGVVHPWLVTECLAPSVMSDDGVYSPGSGFSRISAAVRTVSRLALPARRAILFLLLLCLSLPAAAYDRPRWADADRDCKDTRAEVLEQQCASVAWDARGCRVQQAVCLDVYSGAEIATDTASQSIQVDHIYPASVAWERGTWLLADGSRCVRADRCPAYSAFFNDAQNLLATRARTNGQKSDRMPAEWCPGTRGARILAAKRLRAVAARYRLPLTARDETGLRAWEAGSCATGAAVLGTVR